MKHILKESGIIALTTTFILALLQPFGIDHMTDSRVLFILCMALCTLLLSSCILALLTRHSGPTIRLRTLLLFHLINIPLLSVLTLFTISWFNWGNGYSAWYCTEGHFSLLNYLTTCLQVSMTSVFIFVVQLYRMRNMNLQSEIIAMRRLNNQLEQRQSQFIEQQPSPEVSTVTLTGNANNATLTLRPTDIIYIESMANYAQIWLLECDTVRSHTLRITKKQLRSQLTPFPHLFTCHRAFMVNLRFIESVSGCLSKGCQLHMFAVERTIPVSRTYADEFALRIKGL